MLDWEISWKIKKIEKIEEKCREIWKTEEPK